MIVPIHNHSEYSAIDGLSTAKEIAQRVIVEMGCPCCGLTDHGVVAGHIEFDKEIRAVGGKPIFGCEIYHGTKFGEALGAKRDQAHLIVLAKTDEGLINLWRLNDAAGQEDHFHHVGRSSWEDIAKYKEGLIVTSACPAGLVAKGVIKGDYSDLNRYLDIFGDNFYIELTTYPGDAEFFDKDLGEPVKVADLNLAKYRIAQERGIPVVYGDDGHYAFPNQYQAHDAYVAKSMRESIDKPVEDRSMWHPEGALCIKTEDEVRQALSYLPQNAIDEAISNTVEIGEQVDAHLPETRRHLPVFVPNESPWVEKDQYQDEEADLLFVDLVTKGMYDHYGEEPPAEVIEQTCMETEVFIDAGLHHYFILAWDVMQFCDNAPERPIERGPGRGSSAGCIVAKHLGITDIDPLPYKLYFERFWNAGRAKGFPDIDSDFEKGRRKEVKEYITRRWGHENVRSIGTVTRMKPKGLVESMASICGITFEEEMTLRRFIEQVPDIDILGVDQVGWDSEHQPGKVVYVMHGTKETPHDVGDQILTWVEGLPEERQAIIVRFLEICAALCNRVSNYGVHASGIVISDASLAEIAPSRFAGSKDQRIPVTQFPMDDIDRLMLVKFDALGLRTLDVLADWRAQMAKKGLDINSWSNIEWEDYDEDFWQIFDEGFTAGIFQMEEAFARKIAKDVKPRSVEDLSILVALNRPGLTRTGAPDSFILRKNGESDERFDGRNIPILEETLSTTFGWFLYQEQVIEYFRNLGYDLGDADAVRKILGKKQPEKWEALHKGFEEWQGKSYLEKTQESGLSPEISEEVWSMLVSFAKYSFNKAHSVAYATTSFRCAFAKNFGAPEFYAACIKNVDKAKKSERIPSYINEARRWGLAVHGPDIEYSEANVAVHNNEIYFGFNDIKNVAETASEYLVELREQGVDVSSPEKIYEYLEEQSKAWSKENQRIKKEGLPKIEGKSPKQRLNAKHIESLYTAGVWERTEGYPTALRDMQAREKESLSVIITDDAAKAFDEASEEIEACDSYDEALNPIEPDSIFLLPGVVTNVREVTIKQGQNAGKPMGIVTIEFEGKEIEFAVFSHKWASTKFMWHERTPGIFKVKYSINQKTGRPGYSLEEVKKI